MSESTEGGACQPFQAFLESTQQADDADFRRLIGHALQCPRCFEALKNFMTQVRSRDTCEVRAGN
ncbi:MAG: hypothetical protein KKC46_22990 [Proteobacteria bacterium]|nr:hypothetical protein [Pseudomonadota bacterium]